jgi:hypothetical protein
MKQRLLSFALALGLVLSTGVAYASCTTTTVMIDGTVTICTTCCYNGNCNVTCY